MQDSLPIHIGLHKTGSTYLQRAVFPALFAPGGTAGSATAIMGREAKLILEAVSQRQVELANPRASSRYLSSESLSGRQKANYSGECYQRFRRFVDCLPRLGREPRILLIIREHLPWLRSGYMHQYREGTSRSWDHHVAAFSREDLSWSRRIADLSGYPLLVINYSDFRTSPRSTIMMIGRFFEVDEVVTRDVAHSLDFTRNYNAMPSDRATRVLRMRMRFARAINNRIPAVGRHLMLNNERQDRLVRLVDRFGSGPSSMVRTLSIADPELEAYLHADWTEALSAAAMVPPDDQG